MPTYAFKCPTCDVGFDAVRPAGAPAPHPPCPGCGGTEVRRVYSFAASGTGFRNHPMSSPPRNVNTT